MYIVHVHMLEIVMPVACRYVLSPIHISGYNGCLQMPRFYFFFFHISNTTSSNSSIGSISPKSCYLTLPFVTSQAYVVYL